MSRTSKYRQTGHRLVISRGWVRGCGGGGWGGGGRNEEQLFTFKISFWGGQNVLGLDIVAQ